MPVKNKSNISVFSEEFLAIRKRLLQLEEKKGKEYYEQAWEKAGKVAGMLKKDYQVEKVYLYGSLAWGGFNTSSDIDLYLFGLRGNYWKAYGDAEKIAAPIEVSLICEEDAFLSLKKKVLERGILL
jgi:predicted nucleotidyltransferase